MGFAQPENHPELPEQSQKPWQLYERTAGVIEAENAGAGIEISATFNARLVGAISGVERQVDVLIEARWDCDLSRRIIIDAKRFRRKLNVKDVEAFEGMMRDCRAERGILVCPKGWSAGAKHRAQNAIIMTLLTEDDIEQSTYWARVEECYGSCHTKPHRRESGIVFWDGMFPLVINGLIAMVFTGKCDRCHNFQIWCWDCGEKFSLDIDDHFECSCGRLWSSLIEEEMDNPSGATHNAVHLLLLVGRELIALDRRSLR